MYLIILHFFLSLLHCLWLQETLYYSFCGGESHHCILPTVKTTERKTTNTRVHRWPQHSFSSSYRNAHWSLTHKLHPSGSDMVFCCYVSYSIRGVSCGGHSGSYTLCGTTTGGPLCLLRCHRSARRSWTWNSLSHVSCSKDTGLTDEHGTWGYCASLRIKQLSTLQLLLHWFICTDSVNLFLVGKSASLATTKTGPHVLSGRNTPHV